MPSFLMCRDHGLEHKLEFKGEITDREIAGLNLDPVDMRLLEECGKSDQACDWLLALEMLYRRYREQNGSPA